MRVKLLIDQSVLGNTSKLWVEVPELDKIEDFVVFLDDFLGIGFDIDIFLSEFYLHPLLPFADLIKDSDLVFVKRLNTDESKIRIPVKLEKSEDSDDKKDKIFKRSYFTSDKPQGQRIKFTSDGKIKKITPIVNPLNILSPAEEFDQKKSEWKVKPIPKRKPIEFKCPELITKKQEVLSFADLQPGMDVSFSLRGEPRVIVKYI